MICEALLLKYPHVDMGKETRTMAGLQMSRTELMRMAKKAESLQNRVKKATEKADELLEKGVRTIEVGTSAFAFGVVQGRYGAVDIAGLPIDLAAGLGGHILGYMGVGGRMNTHLHALADGALASYAVTMGKGAGEQWRKNATKAALSSEEKKILEASRGSSGAKGSGERLSREELEEMSA